MLAHKAMTAFLQNPLIPFTLKIIRLDAVQFKLLPSCVQNVTLVAEGQVGDPSVGNSRWKTGTYVELSTVRRTAQ